MASPLTNPELVVNHGSQWVVHPALQFLPCHMNERHYMDTATHKIFLMRAMSIFSALDSHEYR